MKSPIQTNQSYLYVTSDSPTALYNHGLPANSILLCSQQYTRNITLTTESHVR